MIQRPLMVLSLLLGCLVWHATCFTVPQRLETQKLRESRLYWVEEEGSSSSWIGQPTTDTSEPVDALHKALEDRKESLKRGIGKRYIVRTQKGFLNVHSDISKGPYATHNIVKQLPDGAIVMSKNRIGDWVQHDQGGWSIARHDGFLWLQPVDE